MEDKNMELMFCTNCGSNNLTFVNNVYCCQSCGSKFEKKQFDSKMFVDLRLADTYRQSTHFDEAKRVYKKIIEDYPNENLTDVYWGLFLCEQNVIFEEDGKGEKFPSFYRINSQSVEDTPSYLKAITYASKHDSDKVQVFNDLGEKIEYARKMYIDISETTHPFEVFICFKNTDENGNHTQDRQLAMDIYNEFSGKYSIFFSEKTLKNIKSNYREYEPNIYYGLYTAKVMLLICSKNDYIESKWLKNEWSRFTQINSKKEEKKCIIPIFMDGYNPNDLPSEIASIQGIFDDRKLISNLEHQLDSIIHPVDKFEELKKQQEEERLRQEQRLAEMASNISRMNMGGNGGQDNKVNNYIDAIKKFIELGNFPKVKESLDFLKNISPNMFEVYWYSMYYENKCTTLENLSKIPNVIYSESFITSKSFASIPEQKNLVKELENKYKKNIENLLNSVKTYFENGNYNSFVESLNNLAKFDTSSFEYRFFSFAKSKMCGSFDNLASYSNLITDKNYIELKNSAKTQDEKDYFIRIEKLRANKDARDLSYLQKIINNGELQTLAKDKNIVGIYEWYNKQMKFLNAVFLKAVLLKEIDSLVRPLYIDALKEYRDFLKSKKEAVYHAKQPVISIYSFSNKYNECFPEEFKKILDLPYNFIESNKKENNPHLEELKTYLEQSDVKPIEDLQKEILDLQKKLLDKNASDDAILVKKNKKEYNKFNILNLIATLAIIVLTFLGSVIYMCGLPLMPETTPLLNVLLVIVGLGAIPLLILLYSKFSGLGIGLGIVGIFVLLLVAGLIAHAPLAVISLAIQIYAIIFWLIPQIRFYFYKRLSLVSRFYIPKKAKRILIIKYIFIAVALVLVILNLDKINMSYFFEVLASIIV